MGLRKAEVTRRTNETDINIKFNIDGTGKYNINTGIGFLNHMLEVFCKHGFFDLYVNCTGDLHIDSHHSAEDIGITLGTAILQSLGDKKGIKRYGQFILPMDDALILCAVDLCGRPYFISDITYTTQKLGTLDTEMIHDFFYALTYSAVFNLHFKKINGFNNHHIAEAEFKSFAKALDIASSFDERINDILSTKGTL